MKAQAWKVAEDGGPNAAVPAMVELAEVLGDLVESGDGARVAGAWFDVHRWLARDGLHGVDRDAEAERLARVVESSFDGLGAFAPVSFVYAASDVSAWHGRSSRREKAVEIGRRVWVFIDEHAPQPQDVLLALAVLPSVGALYEMDDDAAVIEFTERPIAALRDREARAYDPSLELTYALLLKMRAFALMASSWPVARALWLDLAAEFQTSTDPELLELVSEARAAVEHGPPKSARSLRSLFGRGP